MIRPALLLAGALSLAACGGGGTPTPTPAPTPTPTPAPTPTPTPVPADVRDLSAIGPAAGFLVTGANGIGVGHRSHGLGDVNGDGIADFAVSVRLPGGAGDTFAVVFGRSTPPGSLVGSQQVLDYASLTPDQGFLVTGAQIVGSAGDINGDGLAEIAFGRPLSPPANEGNGYIIFGRRGPFGQIVNGQSVISVRPTLAPSDGFVVRGKEGGDGASRSISAAGDVNGDGFGDLLVGSPTAEPVGETEGSSGNAYIMFGHSGTTFGVPVGGESIVYLGGLNPGEGVLIAGDGPGALAGTSVAPLGDFNGDGIDDVVVGAPGDRTLYSLGGAAFVVFGTRGSFGPTVAGQTTIYVETLSPSRGLMIAGDYGVEAGSVVTSAGDFNDDGLPDLFVGGNGFDSYVASAFVVFGTRSLIGEERAGRRVLNLATLAPSVGMAFKGGGGGFLASGVGDFNGDGMDDLLLGDPIREAVGTRSGVAYVIYGSRQRFGTLDHDRDTVDLGPLPRTTGIIFKGAAAEDGAGSSVSGIGDFNRDGRPDLLIGASAMRSGGRPGVAYVIYGQAP